MEASRHYSVRFFDASRGMVVEEAATAASEVQIRELYGRSGRVLLELRPIPTRRAATASRTSTFDASAWCRELKTLLVAGMTVVEALETLQAQAASGPRQEVLSRILRSLREGQALSQAMVKAGAFPSVLIAGVTAGERTANLVEALTDYLAYDEMLARLRRQVVSAAVYPAVVIVLGAAVTLLLLVYVIPRFSKMYVGFKGALSAPTQFLLFVSDALQNRLTLVTAMLLLAIASGVWAWRSGTLSAVGHWTVERIAPLRRGREHFARAKLYQALTLMFKGGSPLDEALRVCAALGLGQRETRGIEAAIADIARGQSVSTSFAAGGLSDIVATRLLAVGERSGQFDTVLGVIAERHAQAFATFIERATRLVEPLLLLLVALVVGGIVVMMYMPIFDIAGGVR